MKMVKVETFKPVECGKTKIFYSNEHKILELVRIRGVLFGSILNRSRKKHWRIK